MRAGSAPLTRDFVAREATAARLSVPLAGSAQTTAHVGAYAIERTELRVVVMRR